MVKSFVLEKDDHDLAIRGVINLWFPVSLTAHFPQHGKVFFVLAKDEHALAI